MMKILLIVPAFNEEKSLPSLLQEFKDFPQYEIVVVNDCSRDQTEKIAKEFAVKGLNLPINLGLSGAVQTGFLYAVEHEFDVCIQIDGDGQHIPQEISKLIDKIQAGADIAIGSRFLTADLESYEQSFFRKLGAKYISFLVRLFSGIRLTDPTSGMRAFTKEIFTHMAEAANERPEPDTMLYFARKGYRIEEVQVQMRERMAGESYLTLNRAVIYMIENTLSMLYVCLRTKRVKRKDDK